MTVLETDVFGETNTTTLLVRYEPGGRFVTLVPRGGPQLLVEAEELRGILGVSE
jgi:hypothetical protein